MKSIFLSNPGGPSNYIYKDVPIPEPLDGHVIEIKAFGLNHAEIYMRKRDWPETDRVSGIECVGLVRSCPGGEFKVGTKVAALMGGMGRSIPGSYAEYTRVPSGNVTSIESDLRWEDLAALSESYATAWTCIFQNLEITKGQTLLVRGGTSALGYGTIGFPLSDVPLQKIANDVARGAFRAKPTRVFRFEEVAEAHKLMEENQAGGKFVDKVAD